MRKLVVIAVAYLIALPAGAWIFVWQSSSERELLNVSYDPTRELWREINEAFSRRHLEATGERVAVRQSHGGSGSQARAVMDGLPGDIVSLALWSDTNAIHRAGLIAPQWELRPPPFGSLPFYSTIVFVVRQGNPAQIHDWPDLIRPGVAVITPNPKTSGNGRLAMLAAWGAVRCGGGSEPEAETFVRELYRHAPVLDASARASAMTFATKRMGDVLITWENEAHLTCRESRGQLEIIYPHRSIRAEPHVTLVDAHVDRKGTRDLAMSYLAYLHTPEAQAIMARNYCRPRDPAILARFSDTLKPIELFGIEAVARDWDDAQLRFFGDGGYFDRIYQPSE
jgi:sulfate transport system substrate-binding protein